MFRTIQWTSGTRLSCTGCAPAQVILCIDPDLLAERTCPASDLLSEDTPEGVFEWNTIPAELVDSVQVKNNCGGAYFWRYTFNYDDAYIKVGSNLSSSDITNAVCQGCMTQYAEDLVGNEIVLETVAASGDVPEHLKLTSQHGCEYDFFTGIASFTESDDCAVPGIGLGKSIISASITGGVVTLDAAEMPILVSTSFADSDDVSVNVHPVATHSIATDVGPITVTNTSECLTADLILNSTVIVGGVLSAGWEGQVFSTFTGDLTDSVRRDWTNSGTVDFTGMLPAVTYHRLVTLAPGDTLTFSVDIDVATLSAGSGAETIDTYSVGINLFGFTHY